MKFDTCCTLLSYAHGHHVFINWCTCYQLNSTQKTKRMASGRSMRVGEVKGAPRISFNKEDFLRDAFPKIVDSKLKDETSILWAICWCNEADIFSQLSVLQIEFSINWIALEALANTNATHKSYETLLTNEQISKIRTLVRKFLREDSGITDSRSRSAVYSNLKCIQRRRVVDKINLILEDYGLGQYKEEIPELNKLRNEILHGRVPHNNQLVPAFRKLSRINEKLILSILDVYDKQYIHHAIREDDLLAR